MPPKTRISHHQVKRCCTAFDFSLVHIFTAGLLTKKMQCLECLCQSALWNLADNVLKHIYHNSTKESNPLNCCKK